MTSAPHAMNLGELERLAQRRAKAKMGWYGHASVYLLVNSFLVFLSARSPYPWAVFPALGWGLGLLIHGAAVFMFLGSTDWRERMVQKERDRIARRGQGD